MAWSVKAFHVKFITVFLGLSFPAHMSSHASTYVHYFIPSLWPTHTFLVQSYAMLLYLITSPFPLEMADCVVAKAVRLTWDSFCLFLFSEIRYRILASVFVRVRYRERGTSTIKQERNPHKKTLKTLRFHAPNVRHKYVWKGDIRKIKSVWQRSSSWVGIHPVRSILCFPESLGHPLPLCSNFRGFFEANFFFSFFLFASEGNKPSA